MFELIRDAIAAHQTIILHRHTNPDGDALGSQIGLKHLILANYPDKTVHMVGDGAGRYGFMEDSIMDEIPDSAYQGALAIVLDTSAKSLISDTRYTLAAQTARIDHHIFVEKIADIEATDDTFESCCGLVAQMAQECSWSLNPQAATALFTGMVTDSGRFRYDATNARTFRLASYLMEQPIDTNALYRNLYASDYAQLVVRSFCCMCSSRRRTSRMSIRRWMEKANMAWMTSRCPAAWSTAWLTCAAWTSGSTSPRATRACCANCGQAASTSTRLPSNTAAAGT